MPRKSKTQATSRTAPGQPYGMAGEQVAAMKQIPLPDQTIDPSMTAPTGIGAPTPPPTPPQMQPDVSQIGAGAEANQLETAFADATMMPAPSAPAFSTPVSEAERQAINNVSMTPQGVRQYSPVVQLLQDLALTEAGDDRLQEIIRRAIQVGY